MYLDAVKATETAIPDGIIPATGENNFRKSFEVYEKWQDWQASEISHHGKICCEIAREWLTAKDFSELAGGSLMTGPRWLRQLFSWGASSFPIYWCEAVKKNTLDCGALAALSSEIFKARGIKNYRVQMVQRFSSVATAQWSSSWHNTSEPLPWMNGDLIYHEGCAIKVKDEIKIWDSSAGWWINPNTKDGYGTLLALRISALGLTEETKFKWGNNLIKSCLWTSIQ